MGFLGKALATVCLYTAITQHSAESLAWGLFVVKFFSDWSQPTVWGTCTDLGGKNAGTVFSIVNTTGNFGGLVIPLVVGPLLDHYSTFEMVNGVQERITDYGPMFVMVGIMYMISAVVWLFINCTKPIDPEEA
jgi:sugar phosphate permease